MTKLVKLIVCGRLAANGRLNAEARETVALYVEPSDPWLRTFIMKAAVERFAWLAFVPLEQQKLHWIGESTRDA